MGLGRKFSTSFPPPCVVIADRYNVRPHCGCSSVVERYLAKVDVVSSNLITRFYFSFFSPPIAGFFVGYVLIFSAKLLAKEPLI